MQYEDIEHLISKQSDNCWVWQGYLSSTGYGRYWEKSEKKEYQAHRLVYTLLVGPIPTGLVLDHLCRVHNCVNPAHLEPVSPEVNTARGLFKKVSTRGIKHTHTRSARRKQKGIKEALDAAERHSKALAARQRASEVEERQIERDIRRASREEARAMWNARQGR